MKTPGAIRPLKRQSAEYRTRILTEIIGPLISEVAMIRVDLPDIAPEQQFRNRVKLLFNRFEKHGPGREELLEKARDIARWHVGRMDRWHRTETVKQFHRATRLDVSPLLRQSKRSAAAIEFHAAAIANLPLRFHAYLDRQVAREFGLPKPGRKAQAGGDAAVVLQGIVKSSSESAYRTTRSLTNGLTNNLVGNYSEERQTDLGVKGYIWRDSGDGRVRRSHSYRDGKRYAW